MKTHLHLLIIILLSTLNISYAQLNVTPATNTTTDPLNMVKNILAGNGVTIMAVSYTGNASALGTLTTGSTSTNLGLSSGIALSSGKVVDVAGANNSNNKTTQFATGSTSPELAAIVAPTLVKDVAMLTITFIPLSDSLKFNYVFGSEEYPEYVNSKYNDVFGFFISGPNPTGGNYTNKNLAIVPNTTTPVAINNINSGYYSGCPTTQTGCKNCNYYLNNCGGSSIQLDGLTTKMKAACAVIPCQVYTIKIAIGDVADDKYDSGVFIEENSFTSNIVEVSVAYNYQDVNIDTIAIEGCNNASIKFSINEPSAINTIVNYTIGGTAINGVDYKAIPTSSITIPAGQTSYTLAIEPLMDGMTEGTETITLDVQSNVCKTSSLTLRIKDNIPISVDLGTDKSACNSPSSFSLAPIISGGIRPYNYEWSNDGGSDSVASYNPNVTSTYILTVTDHCLSTATDNLVVAINNINPKTSSSESICSGTSTILTTSGGDNYSWSSIPTGFFSTLSTPTVAPTVTTTYTVTISKSGCTTTDAVIITVLPTPIANAGTDISLCEGSQYSLQASGGSNYKWNDGKTGAINTLTFNTAGAFTYSVTVSNSNNCSNTDNITITVNPSPSIDAGPDKTICRNASTDLIATGASSYSWSNTSIGSTISVTPSDKTTYTVTGTLNGCSATDNVIIDLYPITTTNISVVLSPVCNSQTTSLTASDGSSWLWSTGETTKNIIVNPSSNTTYSLTTTDINNCTAIASAGITTNPNITVNAVPPIICRGGTSSLFCSGADTYQWSQGSSGQNVIVSPTITTTYTVTASTANCTQVSDVVVTVIQPLPITINGNTSICAGSSTILTANGSDAYIWNSSQATPSITVTPDVSTTYIVTSTDKNNCTNTAYIKVTITPLPIVDVGNSISVCAGSLAIVNATGGDTYIWSGGINNGVAFTPVSTSTYKVTATKAGCTATDEVLVIINPLPFISVNDMTICAGSSATLIASGGNSYSWSDGLGNGNNKMANPSSTTSYTVTGTDANGCSKTAVSIVTVNPLPIITTNNPSICIGDSIALIAFGANSYIWDNNVGNGNELFVKPLVNTTYSVTGTDTKGCKNTTNTSITIKPIPILSINAPTICFGKSANLNVSGANTYLWSDGLGIGNTKTVNPDSTSTYTVTGSNANGCSASISSVVTVNSLPPVLGNTDMICTGESTMIKGLGATSYLWSNGQTGSNFPITPNSTVTYTVTGTEVNGCSATSFAKVEVFPIPNVTVNSPTVCNGSSANLAASGALLYKWSNSLDSISTVTVTPLVTTTYSVTGTDNNRCSAQAIAMVTVPDKITINSITSMVSCKGGNNGSIQVIANGGISPYSYLWNITSLQTTPNAQNLTAGTYIVTATDAIGCFLSDTFHITEPNNLLVVTVVSTSNIACFGDSTGAINITASGGIPSYTYNWSNLATTEDLINIKAGNYTLSITDANSCTKIISVDITQPATALKVDLTTYGICFGQSSGSANAIISGGTPTYVYQWNTTPIQSSSAISNLPIGTYTVSVSDLNNCTAMASAILTMRPEMNVIAVNDTLICEGYTTTLQAIGGNTYEWFEKGLPLNSIIITPTITNTYTVIGTDIAGCTASDEIIISVTPSPSGTIFASKPAACAMQDINFWAKTSSNGIHYFWNLGNGQTSTDSIVTGIFNNEGNYPVYLVVTNNGNCSDTIYLAQQIQIFPTPTAEFTSTPSTSNDEGTDIVFDASESRNEIVTYRWIFGDNTPLETNILPSAIHSYKTSGTYFATLIVDNKYGCTDSIRKSCQTADINTFYIPNSFTPNGDGVNDDFGPEYYGKLEPFDFSIYNRWGGLVFHTKDPKERWNGSLNNQYPGQTTQMVYVWRIITSIGGLEVPKEYTGTVTLIGK